MAVPDRGGRKLPLTQDRVPLQGHAVEARIYAEDPARGFLPSTGTLLALHFPDGVRVDTGVEQGSAITPYYDPMIAKMIAHAPTREAALDKLAAALEHTIAAGPHTNLALLAALCRADGFRAGTFDTGFIERNLATLGGGGGDRAAAAFGAAKSVGAGGRADRGKSRSRARCAGFALGCDGRVPASRARPRDHAASPGRRRAG